VTRPATWRRALGLVVAATGGVALGITPAAAEEPTGLGWWWAGRPTATLPALFSPVPSVPDGGLYVAGDPTRPSGISALRFQLDPDATAATLTLTIAETVGTPLIDACVAAEGWEPAENGGWDQRPEPDCEAGSVTGTVNDDETEVHLAMFEFQSHDGVLDVVLVPGVDPETERPASFSVAFEPPDAQALGVIAPTGTDTAGAPSESPPTAPAPAASPTPGPSASPSSVAPATPPVSPTGVQAPTESDNSGSSSAAASLPSIVPTGFPGTDDFAYPAVLGLPLVLLAGGSYLGWTLTRPVVVRGVPRR
jgi:hypothetical protein